MIAANFPKLITSLLLALVVAPTAYFFIIPPQPAHAFDFGAGSWATFGENVLMYAQQVKTYVLDGLKWVATKLAWFNEYVLQPMATILSGHMVEMMTSNIIANVTLGDKNGTGAPQFIQDLRGHQQKVGTNQAELFFTQLYNAGHSAENTQLYTDALVSSLRGRFLRNSSSASFFSANKDTLSLRTGSAANSRDFLNGRWDKGGVKAWFALTTQDENNPYILHQRAEAQVTGMMSEVQATANKVADWGKGMLSFCGKQTPPDPALTPPTPGGPCTLDADCGNPGLTCDTEAGKCVLDELQPVVVTAQKRLGGTAVGDPCTNKDGTPGQIKTPASVISASLDKALALPGEKASTAGGGKVSTEIISALKSVNTLLTTVNLAKEILGSGSNDKGLVGSSLAVSAQADKPGYMGVTDTQIKSNAPNLDDASAAVLATGLDARLPRYEKAWGILRATAEFTQAALQAIVDKATCTATQRADAQQVINDATQPTLDQADTADGNAAAAEAMLKQLADESPDKLDTSHMTAEAIAAATNQYQTDAKTLASMPPSEEDVTKIEYELTTLDPPGGAVATPPGYLFVAGGTLTDNFALISTNAEAILNTCP